MKSNLSAISPLRQQLDMLGAQFQEPTPDPILVMTCCRNVAMAAGDKSKPLPDDIFAAGLDDTLMRCALSGLCMAVVQMLVARTQK